MSDLVRITPAHEEWAVGNASADDIRFASGNIALKIPFELYNNHIYVKVAVNGSKPLWFLLDTGSSHIIDTRQAKTLGLKLKSLGKAVGVGEGTVDLFGAERISFSLPGVSLTGQRVGVLPLDGVAACVNEVVVDEHGKFRKCVPDEQRCERRAIDGVLGYGLFASSVVEINYKDRVLNVFAPGNYKYQGPGETLPLDISDQKVFVQGAFLLQTARLLMRALW